MVFQLRIHANDSSLSTTRVKKKGGRMMFENPCHVPSPSTVTQHLNANTASFNLFPLAYHTYFQFSSASSLFPPQLSINYSPDPVILPLTYQA